MSLKKLFKERDLFYQEYSKKIMSSLEHVTNALEKMIGPTSKYLEWKMIEIVDYNYLLLGGIIQFPIGVIVELDNGNKIQITRENHEKAVRYVRAVFPIDFIESSSEEEVFEYLKDKTRVENLFLKEGEELKEELYEDFDESEYEFDFDFENLTDEQIQNLNLYHISVDKKIN